MKDYKMIATCTGGLETNLAYELKQMGIKPVNSVDGKIFYEGDARTLIDTNLWLRTAERVLLQVAEFDAKNFDELFDRVNEINWEDYVPIDGNVIVSRVRIKKSSIDSPRSAQSIIQKAIFSRLSDKYKLKRLPCNGAVYSTYVYIAKNRVIIALDSSGEGLHKRGYRTESGKAPLRETIAAGILLKSRWNSKIELLDAFCGSGTIPIEAALIAKNKAPGLFRKFAAESWSFIDREKWGDARREARKKIVNPEWEIKIEGSDSDGQIIEMAVKNAERAGVSNIISFNKTPMEQIKKESRYGFLISNPPYGERLKDRELAFELYSQMRHLKKNLKDWSYFIFSSHKEVEKAFGMRANKKPVIYNSGIETTLYFFWGPKPDFSKKGE